MSASLNPLLISLWGVRQGSGCSVKLATDGGMLVVIGRQAGNAGLGVFTRIQAKKIQ